TSTGHANLDGTSDEVDFTLTVTASNGSGTSAGQSIPVKIYADGFANASSCTVQAATLLNGYHAAGAGAGRSKGNGYQPAWNAPGVDYCVGYPTGTTLNDPTVAALPTGCTYSSGSHAVTCSTAGVTVSNFD